MRPLFFLDIDGVLNRGYKHPEGFDYAESECLNVFNRILENFNPYIVISSSWRMEMSYEAIWYRFKEYGVKWHLSDVIGETPVLRYGTRADEIWSSIYNLYSKPEILNKVDKKWLAIDDQPLLGCGTNIPTNIQPLFIESGNWIRTEYRRGLEEYHIDLIRERLAK